jgi:hypothetical protein
MYKLNKFSWSARFFEWVWNTDVEKFKSMCPYFWSYVLTLVFLPIILVFKGLYAITPTSDKAEAFIEKMEKSKAVESISNFNQKYSIVYSTGKVFKWTFFGGLGIIGGFMIGVLLYQSYLYPIEALAIIGAVSLLIAVIAIVVSINPDSKIVRGLLYPFKLLAKFFILLKDMLYSLYRNMCPLIKWKE